MNLSVLVHTFDGYKHLWPGCVLAWRNLCLPKDAIYFGTDIISPSVIENKIGHDFEILYSGPGEWSNRLIKLLEFIPTEYVLYSQEDHWPELEPPLYEAMEFVIKHDLHRLQISPVNQFYSLTGSELPLFFHKSSKYLVSHQPSIWRKDFLLSCLEPGESPWVNEYEGTKRLQKRDISGKIAIYPYDWYSHKCIKGQVQK
jgi:hypothetical protein